MVEHRFPKNNILDKKQIVQKFTKKKKNSKRLLLKKKEKIILLLPLRLMMSMIIMIVYKNDITNLKKTSIHTKHTHTTAVVYFHNIHRIINTSVADTKTKLKYIQSINICSHGLTIHRYICT